MTTTHPDPLETLRATDRRQQEISAKLIAARRALAALRSPAVDDTVTWERHWAATEAVETEIAELYQQRADLDPADTEAQACAAHYHQRATTSREWAAAAKQARS